MTHSWINGLAADPTLTKDRGLQERRDVYQEVRQERELVNLRRGETMRNLAQQHQQAIDEAAMNDDPSASMSAAGRRGSLRRSLSNRDMKGARTQLGKNMLKSLRLKEDTVCAICLIDLVPPCRVSTLACNSGHMFHEDCLKEWMTHARQNLRANPSCPMCRLDIDEQAIVVS